MKPLSASAAAKAVGKSTPTITRAIKSGKISAKKLDGGGYEIEPAELFRVWPAVSRNPDTQPQMLGSATENETLFNSALQVEVAVLKERLEGKDEIIRRLESEITDWKGRDDRNQKLLADLRPPAPQKPAEGRGWFSGWFGRQKPENAS